MEKHRMDIKIHDTYVVVQLDTVTSGLDMLDQILRTFKNSVLLYGAQFWSRFPFEIEQLTSWGFKVTLCAGNEYLDYPLDEDESDGLSFE
jgi:hypothetical protein